MLQSVRISPGDEGKPIQIVRICSKQVLVDEDNFAILKKNISLIDPNMPVAIIAVMGAYRTGKSFFLDLLLRYLKNFASSAQSADWIKCGGKLIEEGKSDDKHGFNWRGGMEKCTEGCWIWSQPFILNFGDKDIALILMDTQGAWDSKMTKTESSTIFGLTAALSSYLVYNVSMQIQEDKVENLHYFLECASASLRTIGQTSNDKPFQRLDFLVRDWNNFEENWTNDEKDTQMKDHLRQHLDSDNIADSSAAKCIMDMFANVNCWLLPHPGMNVVRPNWNGNIEDIGSDFVVLTERYFRELLLNSNHLASKRVMDEQVKISNLCDIISVFVASFKDLVPDAGNLAQAVTRSSHLISKEAALSDFKQKAIKVLQSAPRGFSEESFKRVVLPLRSAVEESFMKKTQFGPESEREKIKKELNNELESLSVFFADENKRKSETALTLFSGILLLVLILFAIDKFSDIACDWYSDTCTRFSAMLFAVYSSLAVIIIVNIFLFYRERGQVTALMAVMEMAKSVIKLFGDYIEESKFLFQADHFDWNGATRLIGRFFDNIYSGLTPTFEQLKSVFFSEKRNSEH